MKIFDKEFDKRVNDVLSSNGLGFVDLVRLAGLDPEKDFRNSNLSGVDFSNQDLTGFDFYGANLSGCNFEGSKVSDAVFDEPNLVTSSETEAVQVTIHNTSNNYSEGFDVECSMSFFEVHGQKSLMDFDLSEFTLRMREVLLWLSPINCSILEISQAGPNSQTADLQSNFAKAERHIKIKRRSKSVWRVIDNVGRPLSGRIEHNLGNWKLKPINDEPFGILAEIVVDTKDILLEKQLEDRVFDLLKNWPERKMRMKIREELTWLGSHDLVQGFLSQSIAKKNRSPNKIIVASDQIIFTVNDDE